MYMYLSLYSRLVVLNNKLTGEYEKTTNINENHHYSLNCNIFSI